jgi:glycosyltransferase involved in cell wall biosynthesis
MKVYADSGTVKDFHSLYEELFECPPEGVEYLRHGVDTKHIPRPLRRAYDRLYSIFGRFTTPVLNMAVHSTAPKADLVHSFCHASVSGSRFVADLECAWSLLPEKDKQVSACKELYDRNRKVVQEVLRQGTCRALIPWNEKGKQSVINAFDYPGLDDKLTSVPLAMRIPKEHEPLPHDGFNLIFLGTSNYSGDWNFYFRGGVRMLRVFSRFCKGKKDVRLLLTGEVPKSEMWRTKGLPISMPGLLSKQQLEHSWRTSDALFYPCYTTPGLAFLEAMRHHVPIVTTDAFANKEVVDSRNGIVCEFTDFEKDGPYGTLPPLEQYTPYEKKCEDTGLEDSLLGALEALYSDRARGVRLGQAGFKEVSEGKFCIERRNRSLLKIYDAALE